ncbi:MAG TPA: YpmS family protein [Cerasibacillus sp.]|uniref:YpmS family protein n=1 Tax=Cerasibacillus sp. TaxID=2498711 RepID=UPI002F4120B5
MSMSRKNVETKKRNWKRLFFILLTVNLIIVGSICLFFLWPTKPLDIPKKDINFNDRYSEFTIQTTKENVNELVNAYLEHLLRKTEHHYQISLEDDVHLLGELPVFSAKVPLSVHLEPEVQPNGDVVLKQKSISLGLLELPNKQIMRYMKTFLPVPDWVYIDPNQEEIYVAVTDMDIKSNFRVKVKTFDLTRDDINLNIQIPYESLGIED